MSSLSISSNISTFLFFSSAVGDGVPLENHNKEVSLRLGGVTPQGNQASNSVSQTQSSSAAGSLCNVPPLAQSNELSLFSRPSGETKAGMYTFFFHLVPHNFRPTLNCYENRSIATNGFDQRSHQRAQKLQGTSRTTC